MPAVRVCPSSMPWIGIRPFADQTGCVPPSSVNRPCPRDRPQAPRTPRRGLAPRREPVWRQRTPPAGHRPRSATIGHTKSPAMVHRGGAMPTIRGKRRSCRCAPSWRFLASLLKQPDAAWLSRGQSGAFRPAGSRGRMGPSAGSCTSDKCSTRVGNCHDRKVRAARPGPFARLPDAAPLRLLRTSVWRRRWHTGSFDCRGSRHFARYLRGHALHRAGCPSGPTCRCGACGAGRTTAPDSAQRLSHGWP